jgi:DNA mismatch endonuclease (patch repair protein)
MSSIKGCNTSLEKLARCILCKLGKSFKTYDKNLPGNPDMVLQRSKKVVFVHGCFWHRHKNCKRAALPQTNRKFWADKINTNASRDEVVKRKLRRIGWRVLTIWQCQTKSKNFKRLTVKIEKFVKG